MMEEIESEELVQSLNEFMAVFQKDIAPYTVQIATNLTTQYQRLIKVDPIIEIISELKQKNDKVDFNEEDGESTLAAVGVVSAICNIVSAAKNDPANLQKLQAIVYPILMHGLTPDGIDVVEDCLNCINLLIYYGAPKSYLIAPEMWSLLPQMMYIVAGRDDDLDGGFGFEFLNSAANCIQNYIAKDPKTLLTTGQGQTFSYLELIFKFLQRILVVNAASAHKMDGIVAMKIIISLMENLQGMMDHALPQFVIVLLTELKQAKSTDLKA